MTSLALAVTLGFAVAGLALVSSGGETETLYAECMHERVSATGQSVRYLDIWRLERPTVLPAGARLRMSLRGERRRAPNTRQTGGKNNEPVELSRLDRPVSVELRGPAFALADSERNARAGSSLPIAWNWMLATKSEAGPFGRQRLELRHSILAGPERIARLTDDLGRDVPDRRRFLEFEVDVRHRSGLPIGFVRSVLRVLPALYLLAVAVLIRDLRRRRARGLDDGPLRTLDRVEKATIAFIIAVAVLFPAALFVSGMPMPSLAFLGEASPINWLSTVQCVLLAVVATALYVVTRLGRQAGSDPIRRAWPWLIAACGFLALGVDEQFGIHEQAPRLIFIPLGLFTDVPGIHAGDVLLPLLGLAGIVLTWFLLGDLRRARWCLAPFLAALVLALLVVVQDTSSSAVFERRLVRRIQIVGEETGEIWAQALFAISMVKLLFFKLRSLLAGLK